jgi:hypothetical protein
VRETAPPTTSRRFPSALRRERITALVALGVHAVVFAFAHGIHPKTATRPAPSEALSPEDTIELDEATMARTDVSARAPLAAREPIAPEGPSVHAMRQSGERERGTEMPPAVGSVETPFPGSWTFSATRPDQTVELSLGASRYKALPEPAPTGKEVPAVPVFAELEEQDVERGLARGGPVAIAIEDVVRQSASGMLGVALFDVTLDRSGSVRVDLVRGDGAPAPWEELRSPIQDSVAKQSVRLPEQAHGLHVRVRVEAKETFADGREVKSLGNSAGVSAGRVGTESVAMKELPNVYIEHRGKVCSGRVSVGPNGGDLAAGTNFGSAPGGGGLGPLPSILTPLTLSGSCSLENIGSPARRTVAARVVQESTF